MTDEKHFIYLPYGFGTPIKRPQSVRELKEEQNFFNEMIRIITMKPSDYVVLSNEDGSEVRDHEGKICIWCKNTHTNKLERKDIIIYKDLTKSNITPREWYFVINYLARYYNTFCGEVIKVTYIQDDLFWHSIGFAAEKEKTVDRGAIKLVMATSAVKKDDYWGRWTFPDEHSRYYEDEDVF